MSNVVAYVQPSGQPAIECTHPLATDTFHGIFRLQLRHLSCLVCRSEWWESYGSVIGSTEAIRMVSRLAAGPRPTGWSAAEGEWRRLAEEGLAPLA